jgi:hypothetical protein
MRTLTTILTPILTIAAIITAINVCPLLFIVASVTIGGGYVVALATRS